MIHLQYRKIVWDSVCKLPYNIPKRNLSTLLVTIIGRSYDERMISRKIFCKLGLKFRLMCSNQRRFRLGLCLWTRRGHLDGVLQWVNSSKHDWCFGHGQLQASVAPWLQNKRIHSVYAFVLVTNYRWEVGLHFIFATTPCPSSPSGKILIGLSATHQKHMLCYHIYYCLFITIY